MARTGEELKKFENLVKGAMGYSEDREDLVSIMSMPFSREPAVEEEPQPASLWKEALEAVVSYKKTFLNGFLVLLVFFTIVRPLIKSLRKAAVSPGPRGRENAQAGEGYPQLAAAGSLGPREKVLAISKENPDKAFQLLKGWMTE